MAKLPEKFKADWLEALRSGQYKQSSGWLFRKRTEGVTFCCLGLAAHILGIPFNKMDRGTLIGLDHPSITDEIADALCEMTDKGYNKQSVLIEMNDSKGSTFSEIAEYIEVNL